MKSAKQLVWTRSDVIGLSAAKCAVCGGNGLLYDFRAHGWTGPCGCVLRAIFRACYGRFRECADKGLHSSRVSLELGVQRRGAHWSRPNEEYVADFLIACRRALTPQEWAILRMHYLLGADWRLCSQRLGLSKGLFFHAVYRIQRKLGVECRALGLYPLRDYFGVGKVAA